MSDFSTSTLLSGAEAFLSSTESHRSQRAQRCLINRLALMVVDVVAIQAATLLAGLGLRLLEKALSNSMLWIPSVGVATALAVSVPAAVVRLYDAAGLTLLEKTPPLPLSRRDRGFVLGGHKAWTLIAMPLA